jgi:anti-sigma B factor antagonist
MKTTYHDYEQLSVVSFDGDVIADDLEPFRHAVQERLDQQVRDFVLDLEKVDFIDSKGLEAVLWLQEAAAELLGQVRLVHVDSNVAKVLELTRLASRFECHDDVEEAIKSMR